jgi:hypothetical protein
MAGTPDGTPALHFCSYRRFAFKSACPSVAVYTIAACLLTRYRAAFDSLKARSMARLQNGPPPRLTLAPAGAALGEQARQP